MLELINKYSRGTFVREGPGIEALIKREEGVTRILVEGLGLP